MQSRWVERFVGRVVKIIVFVIVGIGIFGFFVMALWNWLAPAVLGLHTITYVQAVGILILSKILFGGFRPGRGPGGHWRRRMQARWEAMSPEEREKFRQGMSGRCGHATGVPPFADQPGTSSGA